VNVLHADIVARTQFEMADETTRAQRYLGLAASTFTFAAAGLWILFSLRVLFVARFDESVATDEADGTEGDQGR
jgi:hypothetical protein